MMPVASGTMLPMRPISARVKSPSAIAPVYRARYGTSPRRFCQVDFFDWFVAAFRGAVAAVLIAEWTSDYRALLPHPGNAGMKDPSTGSASLPDSTGQRSEGFVRSNQL